MRKILAITYLLTVQLFTSAQDTSFERISQLQLHLFKYADEKFSGEGWDILMGKIRQSNYVLIGEDHFLNEVPAFVSAITKQIKFDNFFVEVDPYSAGILQQKLKTLSRQQFEQNKKTLGNTFSFYAMQKEMELLKQVAKSKTNIYGTDQVLMIADRLLCSELINTTKNALAKKLFEKTALNSKLYFDSFLTDQRKPMYMLTPEFENDMDMLLTLPLSTIEKEQVKAMKLSRKIYMEQNHSLRIQLMKNNLLKYYKQLQGTKNLFKFGAGHMCKGESLLKVYDLGNVINNIADSRYEKSLHIMIVGKNGKKGSPFEGFPAETLDPYNGDLKALSPFFNLVKNNDWHCFDMAALQEAIEKGTITVTDKLLRRAIEGFDYIVIIPEVTAENF